MKARCCNPKNKDYNDYAARGITVCERWLLFDNFLADMGEAPAGMWLDRIDNNKGYEPSNCRWVSPKDQQNNRRDTHVIEFCGRTMSMQQSADYLGINRGTLKNRLLRYGWSVADSLITPVDVSSRHRF